MGISLTVSQVTAMAPDTSSASAGKKLAAAKHWQNLGSNEQVLWGECQGSALYQVCISIDDLSYRCSCPSRKLPCKHILGLLLLAVNDPTTLPASDALQWVIDWQKKQATANKRKETREENKATGKVSKPNEKSAEKRRLQVASGIEHLDQWLNDLVHHGLGALETQPATFWENQAARMVDFQAPGLASRLRRMASIPNSGANWPEKLLLQLGSLSLLTETYQKLDRFEPTFQEEIRLLIGWTIKEEEVLATGTRLTDDCFFLGQVTEDVERGKNQRTWLLGRETRRSALVYQFSYAGTPFSETYPVGSIQQATLAFWPGKLPQRALIQQRQGDFPPIQERLPGHELLAAFFAEVTEILSRSPWRERFLCVLRSAVPLYDAAQNQWWLSDQSQQVLPLAGADHWLLLALSGGYPVDFAGEWNGETLLPLGVLIENTYHIL